MAIARLSMKLGKRGKGGPHADYIMRRGEYALQHEKFEKLEAVVEGNMPTWAVGDPRSFFEASDANERANARYSYREMELSLPRELTPEQRLELMNEWCEQELPNYPYLYAIHNPRATDGGEQPHAHLMFSERENDGIERDEEHFFKRANGKHPERGGARKTYNLEATKAERQNRLTSLRQRWQEHVNEHLARAEIDARIDMRSYADQGVDKEPQPKMTPWQAEQRRRAVAEANAEAEAARQLRADAREQASKYIREKKAELAAMREREQERRRQAAAAAKAKRQPQEAPSPASSPSPSPAMTPEERAAADVRRLLHISDQGARAESIRAAMADPDDRYADEFMDQMAELGIGSLGELPPAQQQTDSQRDAWSQERDHWPSRGNDGPELG